MKLLGAEFVTSAAAAGRPDGIPRDGLPHVALAGRSNVGKSTLINALCRRRVARTSAAPGKTRLANIYRVSVQGGPGGPGRWGLYLVDLPGYGYARGGPGPAAELRAVAEGYFRQAQRNSQVPRALLVVDARHPGLESDTAASRWLASTGVDQHIVATKIDKLSRGERTRNLKALEDTFGTAALPVSAVSGEGLDALWQMIAAIVRDGDR